MASPTSASLAPLYRLYCSQLATEVDINHLVGLSRFELKYIINSYQTQL